MEIIYRLSKWYKEQCRNDWHEDHGVKIDTLDNPGWSLKIDLDGTNLEDKIFEDTKIDRSDEDWIFARKNGNVYESFGGPLNLEEMIGIFLGWSE